MTWQNSIRGHAAWDALERLREEADGDEWPDDPEVRDAVDRVRWLARHVKTRFERIDTRAASLDVLNALQNGSGQMISHLANMRSSPHPTYVASVHQHCDGILSNIASWPPTTANKTVESIRSTAEKYRADSDVRVEELRERVAELAIRAEASVRQIDAEASQMQSAIAESSNRVADQTSRLDQALDQISLRSQEAEAVRQSQSAEAVEAIRSSARDQMENIARESHEQRSGIHADTSGLLSELGVMRDQARSTLQAIGVDATASHYGTYAKQQRRAAFAWSVVTVVLGLAGATAVVVALQGATSPAVTWPLLSLKSVAGTILLGIAAYAGAQASGHRKEERRSKRIELGLAALDPFLANVAGEDVNTLRLALGAELFASPPGKDREAASPLIGIQEALLRRALGRSTLASPANEGGVAESA